MGKKGGERKDGRGWWYGKGREREKLSVVTLLVNRFRYLNATFTPAQLDACCAQQVACCAQLVALV